MNVQQKYFIVHCNEAQIKEYRMYTMHNIDNSPKKKVFKKRYLQIKKKVLQINIYMDFLFLSDAFIQKQISSIHN